MQHANYKTVISIVAIFIRWINALNSILKRGGLQIKMKSDPKT